MVTCLRAFYGFSARSLKLGSQTLRFPYGLCAGNVQASVDSTGLETPVRSVLRAPYGLARYLYDQSCVAYRAPMSASMGYICQVKSELCHLTCIGNRKGHARTTQYCLRVFYRNKIVGSPCVKTMHAQRSSTGYTAPVQVQNVKRSCRPA